MSFNLQTVTLLSSDGVHALYAEIYEPRGREPVGVVQLSHGMVDHVGRYGALAEFLTENGFVFAGHCHLGHGKSAVDRGELGYFADKGGAEKVIADVGGMNAVLRERFPGLPIFLFGHSMGSFIARIYAERCPETVDGLIIHGTGGPNRIIPLGRVLVRLMMLFLGGKHRSTLMKRFASVGYNSKFPKEEGSAAWLTRDNAIARAKADDPYANFTFTLSAYGDLFRFVSGSNSKEWFDEYPVELPTLIISGDMDPVGGFGKGVTEVYDGLKRRCVKDLTLKLYEGARHELFNEINRDEVFSYLVSWLSGERV